MIIPFHFHIIHNIALTENTMENSIFLSMQIINDSISSIFAYLIFINDFKTTWRQTWKSRAVLWRDRDIWHDDPSLHRSAALGRAACERPEIFRLFLFVNLSGNLVKIPFILTFNVGIANRLFLPSSKIVTQSWGRTLISDFSRFFFFSSSNCSYLEEFWQF